MKQLCFFLFLPFLTFAQNRERLERAVKDAMTHKIDMDTAKTTAWVIGCIDGDSAWVFGYGRLSKETKEKPDGNTIFEVGGVTKAYTATVIHFLVQNKKLNYDEKINAYLNDNQRFVLGNKITLLQLMTHTSGLPKVLEALHNDEKDRDQPYADYTEGMLFDGLKSLDSTDLKIGQYKYSHLNHAILEKIIQNKGAIEDLKAIENHADTSLHYTYAQGYSPAQKPTPNWIHNETFKYSNGLKLNAHDLLDFLKTHLGIKDKDFYGILKETQEPLFKTDVDKETRVGKAWHIMKQKKTPRICLQTGSTNGQSAFIGFVPETKTGVVVLTNSRLVQANLGLLILRILNEDWERKGLEKGAKY
jgi:serine-type D-Ala-D-Ala carboxypeptidase/endopeptidase